MRIRSIWEDFVEIFSLIKYGWRRSAYLPAKFYMLVFNTILTYNLINQREPYSNYFINKVWIAGFISSTHFKVKMHEMVAQLPHLPSPPLLLSIFLFIFLVFYSIELICFFWPSIYFKHWMLVGIILWYWCDVVFVNCNGLGLLIFIKNKIRREDKIILGQV